jgi:hypothetical protein
MGSISERLRRIDRVVLREDRLRTVDGWTRATGRWRVQLGVAVLLSVLMVVQAWVLFDDSRPALFMLPLVVVLSYQAGRMRGEHDRVTGERTFMARVRPPGV